MVDFSPLWLTAKLALITTIILLLLSIPVADWLAHSKSKITTLVETVISMPLVLPPSVLGFYLLLAFSPQNEFGKFLDQYFDTRLVFTFQGLVVCSVIYSLPFMIHPLHSGLKNLSPSLREAAFTLGKSKFTTLTKVLLPNVRASLVTGVVLTFAHTIGEFGVVLMVGGGIPGKTKVISIAVYDEVQSMNYHAADVYAAILFAFSFLILFSVYLFNKKSAEVSPLQ